MATKHKIFMNGIKPPYAHGKGKYDYQTRNT